MKKIVVLMLAVGMSLCGGHAYAAGVNRVCPPRKDGSARPPRLLPDDPPRKVSKAEVEAAVRAIPSGDAAHEPGLTWLRANSGSVANLAAIESSLLPGIYNCFAHYGILQMSSDNIKNQSNNTLSPYMYRRGALQDQVNLWGKLTAEALGYWAPNELRKKQQNGEKVGGRTVDGNFILACIQLGPGTPYSAKTKGPTGCARVIKTDRCDAYKDALGTTICKMADRIAGGGGNYSGGGGTGALKGGTGFDGCLNGVQLPRPEFVGPPSPGTESPPDFKQEQSQLVLKSTMTGAEFESACEQQIELDLKALGVTKMPLMPYKEKHVAISRFGDYRKWDYKGNKDPRWHAGIDLSTHLSAKKRQRVNIIAPDNGKILRVSGPGSQMNGISMKRADSNHVVAFMHMRPSENKVQNLQEVKAGDVIGMESDYVDYKEGHGSGVHLHFEYYVPVEHTGHYTPIVVPNSAHPEDGRFIHMRSVRHLSGMTGNASRHVGTKVIATDPTPFLPENIDVSGTGLNEIFGSTARTQYCITRAVSGGVEGFDKYAAAQAYVLNGAGCDNKDNTEGRNTGGWSKWLPDNDGWGEIDKWLDMSPNGDYDYRSFLHRALDVAKYRFNSVAWSQKIMHLSSLKLWQDYLLARRTEMWLEWQLNQKRARINSMLAVLTAQKSEPAAAQTRLLSEEANRSAAQ